MYLVFYPVNSEKYERHSFDAYDTNKPEWSKEIFKMLYTEFHNSYDFHYFNVSTTSRSSMHCCLDDLVEMSNNEELSLEHCWLIWLNLSEKDVSECIQECEFNRDNRIGDGTEYFIIGEDFKPVTYENDDEIICYWNKEACKDDLDVLDNGFIHLEYEQSSVLPDTMVATVYDGQNDYLIGKFEYSKGEFEEKLQEFCRNTQYYWEDKNSGTDVDEGENV